MGFYMHNGGGLNKKAVGTVEDTPRIDAYALPGDAWGRLFFGGSLVDVYRDKCSLELVDMGKVLELTTMPNRYGGERSYFLCPECGGRYRYLYVSGDSFKCRKCAKLTYRIQQETKGTLAIYRAGVAYLREAFDYVPPPGFCPADFAIVVPPRPRGMRQTTYQRRMERLRRYQERYETAFFLEAMEFMGKKGVTL